MPPPDNAYARRIFESQRARVSEAEAAASSTDTSAPAKVSDAEYNQRRIQYALAYIANLTFPDATTGRPPALEAFTATYDPVSGAIQIDLIPVGRMPAAPAAAQDTK